MDSIEEIYAPIGRVVASFAQLEGTIFLFIAGLIYAEPDITAALVSEMSFARRLDALKSIAPFRIPDKALLDELDEIIGHLSKSEAERNIIVHTVWGTKSSGGLMSFKPTARRKSGVKTNLQDASIAQIELAGDHVRQSITLLNTFMLKLQNLKILRANLVVP